MSHIKKLCLTGIFIALGVIGSSFYIPIGVAKCMPIQHLLNILTGVLLGPTYAVAMAFGVSVIRLMIGTGSLLAFPGSMCGALLAGLGYRYTQKQGVAFLGEVIGTGIIGAFLAYPVAAFLLGKEVALLGFVLPFSISSIGGAILSLIVLLALKRTKIFNVL